MAKGANLRWSSPGGLLICDQMLLCSPCSLYRLFYVLKIGLWFLLVLMSCDSICDNAGSHFVMLFKAVKVG